MGKRTGSDRALLGREGRLRSFRKRPNGQLNHGSMVSSFVHWLKGGTLDELLRGDEEFAGLEELPNGQLVKLFAHEDLGKGSADLDAGGSVDGLDDAVADESDGHGPPEWAMNQKDKKAEKPAKGKKEWLGVISSGGRPRGRPP